MTRTQSNPTAAQTAAPLQVSSRNWTDDHLDPVFSFLRHELGNPVNSLKVTLEVLIRNYDYFDDAKRIDFLRRAQDQISRQQHLLDAMKHYSRFAKADVRPVPFRSVWKKFQNDIRLRCVKKQIEVELPQEPANVWISTDGDAIGRVLDAVVDNALEALAPCRRPKIGVGVQAADPYLKICIQDNAGGIQPDHLSKVFTPLFTTKEGAMGLGLSIARRNLREMKGWMEIETDSKRYTRVTVVLRTEKRGNGTRIQATAKH